MSDVSEDLLGDYEPENLMTTSKPCASCDRLRKELEDWEQHRTPDSKATAEQLQKIHRLHEEAVDRAEAAKAERDEWSSTAANLRASLATAEAEVETLRGMAHTSNDHARGDADHIIKLSAKLERVREILDNTLTNQGIRPAIRAALAEGEK